MLGRSFSATLDSESRQNPLAEITPWLESANLALANLESPLGVVQPGPYRLCAPMESTEAISSTGLDVLSLANNHSQDCFDGDAVSTLNILQTKGLNGLLPAQPFLLEIDGIHFAFLAFDDISKPLNLPLAVQAVQSAHQLSDLVIVSLHWGNEFQGGASSRQLKIAQALTTAGAALIWGHHPHVVQPIQWEKRSSTLIAYSLGNALFDQVTPPSATLSALLLVTFSPDGIRSFKVVPFKIDAIQGKIILSNAEEEALIMRRLGLEK